MSDMIHLEQRHRTYFAVVYVPKDVQPVIGKKKLSVTLRTSDFQAANIAKHAEVAKFKQRIADARKLLKLAKETQDAGSAAWLKSAAEEYRLKYAVADTAVRTAEVDEEFEETLDELRADLWSGKLQEGSPRAVDLEAEAQRLKDLVSGKAIDLKDTVRDWLDEIKPHYTAQTIAQHETAFARLYSFLGDRCLVRDVTRRRAGEFLTKDLVRSGLSGKTIKRYLSSYSMAWKWMISRGLLDDGGDAVPVNPWAGQRIAGAAKKSAVRHAWTPEELQKILTADFPKKYRTVLHDLIRLALLTGARIEELCAIRAEDVVRTEQGIFLSIRKGKTEAATRLIPLHELGVPIVERRLQDGDEFLFANLEPGGRDGKRSHHVSKAFGRYRRDAGITDDLKDFHALRTTFMEAMEGAGVPESTTKLIVGHKRESMTYGRYSKGIMVDLRGAIDRLHFGPVVTGLMERSDASAYSA